MSGRLVFRVVWTVPVSQQGCPSKPRTESQLFFDKTDAAAFVRQLNQAADILRTSLFRGPKIVEETIVT